MNSITRPVRAVAVLVALCTGTAMVATGCESSAKPAPKGVAAIGSASPASPGPGSDNGTHRSDQEIYDTLLAYSKCMRQHGVSNFPYPVLGKGLQINGNEVDGNPNKAAADAACKSLIPAPAAEKDPAGDRAKALAYSKCMRAHGVTKFPDPAADGGLGFDGDKIGMGPDNPVFKGAQSACEHLLGDVDTNAR
jgi:hypothetical protein